MKLDILRRYIYNQGNVIITININNKNTLIIIIRIRSFLAKLRVKKMMLFRFEYVSATKRKGEYFVDTQKQHKWERYPHITGNEAPASPRTITRRLAAVDRRR